MAWIVSTAVAARASEVDEERPDPVGLVLRGQADEREVERRAVRVAVVTRHLEVCALVAVAAVLPRDAAGRGLARPRDRPVSTWSRGGGGNSDREHPLRRRAASRSSRCLVGIAVPSFSRDRPAGGVERAGRRSRRCRAVRPRLVEGPTRLAQPWTDQSLVAGRFPNRSPGADQCRRPEGSPGRGANSGAAAGAAACRRRASRPRRPRPPGTSGRSRSRRHVRVVDREARPGALRRSRSACPAGTAR